MLVRLQKVCFIQFCIFLRSWPIYVQGIKIYFKLLGNPAMKAAKFSIGQIVKHRVYPFRGVIYDVDPEFDNTEEWWLAIPEDIRPAKNQPYYHLLAENDEMAYEAYVSEQNLLVDGTGLPVSHPEVEVRFGELRDVYYQMARNLSH